MLQIQDSCWRLGLGLVLCLGPFPGPLSAQQKPTLRATLRAHEYPVYQLSFSPDGKLLVSGGADGKVILWDMEILRKKAIIRDGAGWVASVAFSPNGALVASGGGDGTVRLWNVSTGKEEAVLKGRTGNFLRVAFSPDSNLLAWKSADDTVKLWDVRMRREKATLNGAPAGLGPDLSPQPTDPAGRDHFIWFLVFSPDGKTLAVADECCRRRPDDADTGVGLGRITLWDVRTSRRKTHIYLDATTVCLAFSPDSRRLAWACDGQIRVWQLTGNWETFLLKACADEINSLAFSPDGGLLASAGRAKAINVWDVVNEKEKMIIEGQGGEVGSLASVRTASCSQAPPQTAQSNCGMFLPARKRPDDRRPKRS